jgi:glycosyltransferase involved in cell wall biosynthesis
MKIGITSRNYAAKRLIINKIENATYENVRFYNFFFWRNAHLWFLKLIGILKITPEKQASKLFYKYKMLYNKKFDIFHFFNTINYSYKNEWVISVESGVPWTIDVIHCVENAQVDFNSIREKADVINALQYLAAPNCKALLSISDSSRNIQLEILKNFPLYEEAIKKKLITLHPPQSLIVNSIEEKEADLSAVQLKFIFVGRDFFRKGGREMLKVFSQLKNNFDFKLTVISDIRIDEPKYLLDEDEIEKTKSFFEANSSWVEYHTFLPNNQVLQLIKEAHVALLPTWMDTYGYSILECQACGCPVISTSLRSLTEINDDKVGWLIEVPVNKLNNPIHNTKEEIHLFKDILEIGLYNSIYHVLTHPDEIKSKAKNCIEKIRKKHDPKTYNEQLFKIYQGDVCIDNIN